MVKSGYILAGMLILVYCITIAAAAMAVSSVDATPLQGLCNDSALNGSYIWLPQSVSDNFYGARINLHFYIGNESNDLAINGVVGNHGIRQLRCGRAPGYDYETSMKVIDAFELATSDTPIKVYVTKWRTGDIKLEANGKKNEMKLSIADNLVTSENEPVPGGIKSYIQEVYSQGWQNILGG